MEETFDLFALIERIVWLITEVIETIAETAERIDSINFDNSIFAQYLGYAAYAMGSTLYALFTTVILIAVGVTLWVYLLKGIGYIKNLLPW